MSNKEIHSNEAVRATGINEIVNKVTDASASLPKITGGFLEQDCF